MIGSYHQWCIEQSFRMPKYDLRARPICHQKMKSIEAHLTVVFAALAITRLIEDRTGWTIMKPIRAGQQALAAEEPSPTH